MFSDIFETGSFRKTQPIFPTHILKCTLYSQHRVKLSVDVSGKGQTGMCSSNLQQLFFFSGEQAKSTSEHSSNSSLIPLFNYQQCDMEFWSLFLAIQIPCKNV